MISVFLKIMVRALSLTAALYQYSIILVEEITNSICLHGKNCVLFHQ